MFDTRWLTEQDYPQLVQWWEDWGWTAPTKDMLPDEGKHGIMVSKDGVDICAAFLYYTNSSFSLVEFLVTNKKYREDDRKEAIRFCIGTLTEIAIQTGSRKIFTVVKHRSLIESYVECGYEVGTEGTTELIKTVS